MLYAVWASSLRLSELSLLSAIDLKKPAAPLASSWATWFCKSLSAFCAVANACCLSLTLFWASATFFLAASILLFKSAIFFLLSAKAVWFCFKTDSLLLFVFFILSKVVWTFCTFCSASFKPLFLTSSSALATLLSASCFARFLSLTNFWALACFCLALFNWSWALFNSVFASLTFPWAFWITFCWSEIFFCVCLIFSGVACCASFSALSKLFCACLTASCLLAKFFWLSVNLDCCVV